jgi:hypothetical protein
MEDTLVQKLLGYGTLLAVIVFFLIDFFNNHRDFKKDVYTKLGDLKDKKVEKTDCHEYRKEGKP